MSYVEGDHRKWDVHVSDLQFALNTARHETSEVTLTDLRMGRKLKGPHQVLIDSFALRRESAEEYHQGVQESVQRLYGQAAVTIQR